MTHVHPGGHRSGDGDDHDAARLTAWWPFVAANLPSPPATVLEIGCGPRGGFVPSMIEAGYGAIGVDPEAPEGPRYRRARFEDHASDGPVDAIVACASLHHVADLDDVADRIASALRPGGTLIVLEWAWERFDEATARWCLNRLPPPAAGDEDEGWLRHHQEEWRASGLSWQAYLDRWASTEGLHTGSALLDVLTSRFDTVIGAEAPYYFSDLVGIDAEEEQAAIDAGLIQPNGIRYVGVVPPP